MYVLSSAFYSTSTTEGRETRLSKKERETIILSDSTAQALVGIMLGDGHIQQRSGAASGRFLFAQTALKHKDEYPPQGGYFLDLFKPYCTQDLKSYWQKAFWGKIKRQNRSTNLCLLLPWLYRGLRPHTERASTQTILKLYLQISCHSFGVTQKSD